ncbi:small multidrug efflux protein [Herbiconiux sp. P15]|uniref:small multidrug efflux protein n=1 Tax=Herbiconiux liukaitaii TaxID=3342799 RepID=UPI0035BB8BD5
MDLISRFQELVAQVPELLQPFIVALAGAVPFIEGEGAATIGVIGGLHPVVAALAGALGNFACVAVLVLVSSGARSAIVTKRRARAEARTAAVPVVAPDGGGYGDPISRDDATLGSAVVDGSAETDGSTEESWSARKAARRAKFQRALDRYGVPGVSLLGPLLLPTQFTATMLAAGGVSKGRVLLWQGIAIAAWTTLFALIISGILTAVG